jgi:hypothetical protein
LRIEAAAIFETKTNMIAAGTNVTGHIMTAPELFLALILLLLIVAWIFRRWQREE